MEDLVVSSDLWEVVVVLWLVALEMEVALQAVGQEVEVSWMERAMAVVQRNGALPARKRVVGWGRASEVARWVSGRQRWSTMCAAPIIPVAEGSDPRHC